MSAVLELKRFSCNIIVFGNEKWMVEIGCKSHLKDCARQYKWIKNLNTFKVFNVEWKLILEGSKGASLVSI